MTTPLGGAVFGNSGDNSMTGGAGADSLIGNYGNDTLKGGDGNDSLYGQADNDVLDGGSGNDSLVGGTGADSLSGGDGADTIVSHESAIYAPTDTATEVDTLNGGDGNDYLSAGVGDIIDGGIGQDTLTLDLSGLTVGLTFTTADALHATPTSAFGGSISNIEAFDTLRGTSGNDDITVSAGVPIANLDGGAGADTIRGAGVALNANGGDGSDKFISGIGFADTLNGGNGLDLVDYSPYSTGISVTLSDYTWSNGSGPDGDVLRSVESVIAGSGNDTIVGTIGANRIEGQSGNDLIEGKGGNDTLIGGLGDDTFVGVVSGSSNPAFDDIVIEAANGGIDTIITTTSLTLPDNVENLSVQSGLAYSMRLTGNGLANMIVGESGHDTLDGGAGADTLIGGSGDDVYMIDDLADTLVEQANGGTDKVIVQSGLQVYTLAANFENLLFNANANVVGIGNNADNSIISGAGNDTLSGGAGNDTLQGGAGTNELIGGAGNDYYVVTVTTTAEAAQQTLYEAAGEGTDTVLVTASVFALEWYGASSLENLTLTDGGNHDAAIGNALDNLIIGASGADAIFGRGGNDTILGSGGAANTLVGNEGDDSYYVNAVGDTVIEYAGEGTDTVHTGLNSFTLPANVENLVSMSFGPFVGIGNELANRIVGSGRADDISGLAGNDTIVGGGGADILQGGDGADEFRYLTGSDGMDRILDFVSGTDRIALLTSGFTKTATVDFVTGGSATSTNSTVLYDANTGIVSYDPDGTGSQAPVQIAQLNAGQTFAAGDIAFL